MNTTIKLIYGLLHNADGAAATEYALLLSGIALAALAGMTILGGSVLGLFTDAVNKLSF